MRANLLSWRQLRSSALFIFLDSSHRWNDNV